MSAGNSRKSYILYFFDLHPDLNYQFSQSVDSKESNYNLVIDERMTINAVGTNLRK